MIIIAGLGNPGKEYTSTRHNVGYDVIDRIAAKHGIKVNRLKFKGISGEGIINGHKVLLLKPLTFMNNSGISIREAFQFYKITSDNLLVILDDIDIDFAAVRIRQKGTAGSHNGLKSVIYHLNDDSFPRIKIGIGKKPPDYELADFVLSKFTKEEREEVDKSIDKASEAVISFIVEGIDSAMNKFNIRNAAQD